MCFFAVVAIGKQIGTQQRIWLAATEARIAATKSMLGSMKIIKMMGIGDKIGKTIEKLRLLEFDVSKKYRHLILSSFVICMYTHAVNATPHPINLI